MKISHRIWYYFLLGIAMLSVASPVSAGSPIASDESKFQQVFLKDLLRELEGRYNVSIAYETGLLENIWVSKNEIDILKNTKNIDQQLERLLKPKEIGYRMARKGFYVLYKNDSKKEAETPKATSSQVTEILKADLTLSYQSKTLGISGTVTDKGGAEGIPGVNILLKGTNIGSVTDASGKYTIEVPNSEGVLVFSFIGYKTQEVPIANRNVVDVVLIEDVQALNEVVVTALGFKEVADRLGSTSSKVNGDAIAKSGETSVINGLAGKAAGVQISRAAGDPGAASFIQIRGQNTLTGNTQPLIVIDGIPVSNTTEGGTSGGVVPQSRLNDINPNDIASMQILKGASAAALWGSRAANGVILITTKRGAEGKMNISFSSTLSLDKINKYHPFQSNYGQGSAGVYNPLGANAWGDKIADRSGGADEVNTSGAYFQAEDGSLYYPIITKNSKEVYNDSNFDKVFRTGLYVDNAISISGGDAKTTYFLSIGDVRQKGIQRGNSSYNRTTARLNVEKNFTEKLKLSTSTAYTKSYSDRIQRGNNLAGAMVGLARNPADFDISDYKGSYYSSPTASPIEGRQRGYRSYLGAVPNPANNNALWALYEQENSTDVDRFINSAELSLKPVSWIDIIARGGIDTYTDQQVNYFPVNDIVGAGQGQYKDQITKETQVNADLLARVTKDISPNITSTYVLGFNINNRKYYNVGVTINDFLVADAPVNFANATTQNRTPVNSRSEVRTTRTYATANFGLYDAVFLNLSGAAESASSFGSLSDKTFYYPSADVAWLFTKLPLFDNISGVDFGKLRASYGVVGVQPLPYRSNTVFSSASFSASPWGDNLVGSQFGEGAYAQSSSLGDQYLKPERKTEYEIGMDLRFFGSRLRTGLTYYNNKVKDVLVPVTLAPSTGFATKYTNAAVLQNKGFEMDMTYDVIKKGALTWSLRGNFTRNRSEVLDLAGTQSLYLEGGIENFMDARAVVGQPIGVFWSSKYALNEDGTRQFDSNGFPIADPVTGVVGNPNPDWIGGFGTSLTYKKFGLDILFETSQGGDYFSGTRGVMYNFGTHGDTGNEVTLTTDLKNYAGATIPAGSTVRGNIEDFGAGPVLLDQSWYTTLGSGFGSLKEQFIEDGSWTRLRQLSLSYRLDSDKFKELTKLQSVDFGVTGRNLLLWTKVVGIDPDTNMSGGPTGRNMDYFNSPGTRSFIFSIKINY
ncbi:TonB-linked SusC/RagA family outer membrane protein [Dyadobacter jejuensis]|uniref:TonB-linked SusC/RagA family outer membrane protein n=1 Tax=Dyadobacter jejuensis TaxID=1082580 RepID=A0A316ACP0_9BACT|nr:SusC/RagA family TonB-linked outer membrane protein [Dyadobacter jejuensis]PWJ54740.1 TonB-linked SusC/RagA family outer membrane protein [Dyadobacter jejuensis]